MPNITLSIPEDTYRIMNKHKEVRWSEVARQAIVKFSQKIVLLDDMSRYEKQHVLDTMLNGSKLTEADVEEIGDKIKQGIYDRVVSKQAWSLF